MQTLNQKKMLNTTEILNAIPVDPLTGSISTPIYQTSTFEQIEPGVHKGFDYARSNNPTRKVLEDLIAKLEHGNAGFAFASGLAAIDAVLKLLKVGDEIVAVDDIYGGAFRIFTHVYEKFGIKVNYVDACDATNVLNAINKNTRFIWLESPTNPTLKIADIEAISKIAKASNCLLVVDNTFASPASQTPITLGADIIIHSGTKYLGGHSDLIAGLVVVNTSELAEKIKFIQNSSGGILGPFDSWLLIRGIETLELRYVKHSENALKVAFFLANHPAVDRVYYPGLESHRNYEIAKKQQKYFGGVLSFSLVNDSKEDSIQLLKTLKYFKLAESLGGVKSLACLPCEMTHKSIPREKRLASGISDSLVRLSVGIENVEDLIEDINSAILSITHNSISFTESN